MKILKQNIKPISFIVVCSCIGHLFGSALTGAVIGLAFIALVTLVF